MKKFILICICIMLSISGCTSKKDIDINDFNTIKEELELEKEKNKNLVNNLYKAKNEMELLKSNNEKALNDLETKRDELKELEKELHKIQNEKNILLDKINGEESFDSKIIKNKDLDNFFKKISETKNLKDLFDLYFPKLDGAYAEGYANQLYIIYNNIGLEQFINELSKVESNESLISDITFLLIAEIIYRNENIDIFETKLIQLSNKENLKNIEKSIIFQMLADINRLRNN